MKMTEYTWTGKARDGDINNPKNWKPEGVPKIQVGESTFSNNLPDVFKIKSKKKIIVNIVVNAPVVHNIQVLDSEYKPFDSDKYNMDIIITVNGNYGFKKKRKLTTIPCKSKVKKNDKKIR